ncbi:hypothetical protein R7Z44_14525 [Vibrio sp. 1409]|uniref:hypothetical protein n=1 Tax=Vibrio sp. 1409 TaxID=3074558 RepID=UPI001CF474D5|nr:hypothetical protein [Vibrio alginolyticus]MDW2258893.1 hypothetical protein [Vibrio sp. 1409]
MELKLTDEQVQTLLHLVKTEMKGFCGDVGYIELSKIKNILEQQLEKNSVDESSTS